MEPDMFTRDWFEGYQLEIFPASRPGYAGTAVLVRSGLEPFAVENGIGSDEFDSEGRVTTVLLDEYEIVSVYAPHSHRELINLGKKKRFMRAFIDYVAARAEQNNSRSMILAGDFNVAFEETDLFHSKTNKGNAGFHDEERTLFGELLDIGFVDALREVTHETGIYSWWSLLPGVKEKNVGWRLDYLLVQEPIRQKISDCFHSPDASGSDHCPVTVSLDI